MCAADDDVRNVKMISLDSICLIIMSEIDL